MSRTVIDGTPNSDPFRVPNSPTGDLSPEDNSFEDDFTPVVPSPIPGPNTTKDADHESLQSKAYLAHLEAKLKKLKGQSSSEKVNPREMLSSLCKVRIDASENLTSEDKGLSFDEPFEELQSVEVSDLRRRVLPEQALTLEELTNLLERDYLNAVTQYQRSEDEEDHSQTR